MSQILDENVKTIESAGDDNLPAMPDDDDYPAESPSAITPNVQGDDYLASGSNKVQLDLEDAPFLKNEPEETEKKEAESQESNTGDSEEGEGEQSGLTKKKLLIIGSCVALLLLLLAGGAYFLFFGEDDPILQNVIVVPANEIKHQQVAKQLHLDPFFIECVDINGKKHFIEATFILSTEDKQKFSEISNNQKVIRDAIYYYLQIQKPEMLLNTKNQQLLKEGLLEAINEYVVNGPVENLFIESYLIK